MANRYIKIILNEKVRGNSHYYRDLVHGYFSTADVRGITVIATLDGVNVCMDEGGPSLESLLEIIKENPLPFAKDCFIKDLALIQKAKERVDEVAAV